MCVHGHVAFGAVNLERKQVNMMREWVQLADGDVEFLCFFRGVVFQGFELHLHRENLLKLFLQLGIFTVDIYLN